MSEEFLSVSELNNFIRDVINSGFPKALWVGGEIQGYDRVKDKKHVFFELCEKDKTSHAIIARVGLVLFANMRPKIEDVLARTENAFSLKDDIEVKFLCKVDFYPAHGQVRLIVENIDPVYTLGRIAQDRQRLVGELRASGVLDKNKRLLLAKVPLNVGLITSCDSAAYHDFIAELGKSGFAFKVFVANALMQGKSAEISVVRALKTLMSLPSLDVIVITRGGGSIAELSCFDSRLIAQAIAECPLAVLSGIGHEINTTVTDLAAHTYAKTPTAVASFLVNCIRDFLSYIRESQEEIASLADEFLEKRHREMDRCAQGITTSLVPIKDARRNLVLRGDGLKRTIQLRLQNTWTKMNHYQAVVHMADPAHILKRGFSVSRRADGRIIRSVKDVSKNTGMMTVVEDGKISSQIQEVFINAEADQI